LRPKEAANCGGTIEKKLSLRALITASVILLTGRLTLLRACLLASLGKLVTFNFADALPIRNFSRPLRVVSEGGAVAQTGHNDQTKHKRLHWHPHFDSKSMTVTPIIPHRP
jgi:hypothetical protein